MLECAVVKDQTNAQISTFQSSKELWHLGRVNGEGVLKECQQYILILKCTWHLKISPRGCNLDVENNV